MASRRSTSPAANPSSIRRSCPCSRMRWPSRRPASSPTVPGLTSAWRRRWPDWPPRPPIPLISASVSTMWMRNGTTASEAGGAWRNAVRAIQLLAARGILPIVTATELLSGHEDSPGAGMYQQFRDFLRSLGIEKARVKILPVFPAGRLANTKTPRPTEADLDGFDRSRLQCADARVVAADGVRLPDPGWLARREPVGRKPRRVLPTGLALSSGLCYVL